METKLEQIAAKAVKQRPKSVVREIRTPRSVGTGGGRPPPVTRWTGVTRPLPRPKRSTRRKPRWPAARAPRSPVNRYARSPKTSCNAPAPAWPRSTKRAAKWHPPRPTRRGGPGRYRRLHRQGKRQPGNRQARDQLHHRPISTARRQSLHRPSSRRRSGLGPQKLSAGRHIIVYRIAGRDVLILRVAHSRRDLEAFATERSRGEASPASPDITPFVRRATRVEI